VYHVENPARQSWSSVLTPLSKALGLPLTSFDDWLDRVEKLEGDAATLHNFFQKDFTHIGLGRLYMNTAGAKKDSISLRSAGIVQEEIVWKYTVSCSQD
jgi:hypothetical protein